MGFFIEDINIFYLTLYGGIVIGLLFDLYRSLRTNFKIVKKYLLFLMLYFGYL